MDGETRRSPVPPGTENTDATAGAGPPDPSSEPAAFIFADIAGYTALTEAHGDRRAADVADDFAGHARRLLARTDGELVKVIGDALMLRVPEADAAIRLAHELVHVEMSASGHPAVRVGIHFGPAERRGSDWFGASVNTASRIAALAPGGEILVSRQARDAAGPIPPLRYEELGEERLRNVREAVELFRVECDEGRPERFIDPVCRMALDPRSGSLQETYRGVDYHFCSQECRRIFHADPEAVLSADPERSQT